MDVLEKKLIEKVITNLTKSQETDWVRGHLDDWSEHAKEMSTSIDNNVEILKTLIED